jgi:hypothetical protein
VLVLVSCFHETSEDEDDDEEDDFSWHEHDDDGDEIQALNIGSYTSRRRASSW